MKANLIRNYGPWRETMEIAEVESPELGPDEVLIEVHAVTANRTRDTLIAEGKPYHPESLPLVTGQDPAGIIRKTGTNVTNHKKGDRVVVCGRMACGTCKLCRADRAGDCPDAISIGIHRWGGYAEFCAVPQNTIFSIPENLSFSEAAVIMRHCPTAIQLLDDKAQLQPGEWILIMGAGGGLGGPGIQIAKLMGARVIAAAGADERVRHGIELGADFGINYRSQDLTEEVKKITEGRGVDVVYENISDPTTWPKALASLAYAGRLVTAGAHGGPEVTLNARSLYLNRWQIKGAAGGSPSNVGKALEFAKTGKISCFIDHTMPLEALHDAYDMLQTGDVTGKIIIDPSL
jgi:NADPH2:quinone reductase